MFKKMKSLKIPYNKQGLIYFTCVNYDIQPPKVQKKILNLCIESGGEYYQALFDMVTTGKGVLEISQKYYISENTAYRLKRKFYKEWNRLDNS